MKFSQSIHTNILFQQSLMNESNLQILILVYLMNRVAHQINENFFQ